MKIFELCTKHILHWLFENLIDLMEMLYSKKILYYKTCIILVKFMYSSRGMLVYKTNKSYICTLGLCSIYDRF